MWVPFWLPKRIRHASQLKRYAATLKTMDPEHEISTALYFPMLDAWKEVEVAS
jgi:hypothetical protein